MTPPSSPTSSNDGAWGRTSRTLMLLFGLSFLALLNNVRNYPQPSSDEAAAYAVNNDKPVRRAAREIPVSDDEHQQAQHTREVPVVSDASKEDAASTETNSDFFSACLLTMDDSHFLIEWLAYHYHTLPLRHLIVAVDPNSKTSPSFIFEKWRKHGMTIEEWDDTDFMKQSKANQTGTSIHRVRQKTFYKTCLKSLKAQNRTWTLLIDVDEYLSFNTYSRNSTYDIEKPACFMSFLKEELTKSVNETKLHTQSPCIMMPRLRYGSVESEAEEVSRNVPSGLNGSAFQTLKYRKHGPPQAKRLHGAGKTIVDVSRVDNKQIKPSNPHRPVSKCTKDVFLKPNKSPLVVRHYLGSWEQFSFRDDARQEDGMKTSKTYDKVKDLDYAADDAVRPWIKGFVDDIGKDAAMELLEGVGDVSVAPPMMKTA